MSDGKIDKATLCWNTIQEYLKTHDYIMNADVRELFGVSAATANRILAGCVSERKIVKYRIVVFSNLKIEIERLISKFKNCK